MSRFAALNPRFRELERWYSVVIPDALGNPLLGFRDGSWFGLHSGPTPNPLTARTAILGYPQSAGTVVQVICWWMREHHQHSRALDLATELALAVGELAAQTPTRRPAADPLTGHHTGSYPRYEDSGQHTGSYPAQQPTGHQTGAYPQYGSGAVPGGHYR